MIFCYKLHGIDINVLLVLRTVCNVFNSRFMIAILIIMKNTELFDMVNNAIDVTRVYNCTTGCHALKNNRLVFILH